MQKYIECCNLKFVAREYFIGSNNKISRSLFFADSCPKCLKPIAEIRQIDDFGNQRTILRRKGEAALNLQKKYMQIALKFQSKKGSRVNEYTYYQNNGNIYNFNNRFIATHNDFVKLNKQSN